MKSPPSVITAATKCHRPYPLPLLGRPQLAVKPPTPVTHVGAESLLARCCCCCWFFFSTPPPTSISKSKLISPSPSSSPVRCLFSLPGPSLSASGVSVMLGCRPCLVKGCEKSDEVGEGLDAWSEYCGILSIGTDGWPCAEGDGEGGEVI